MSKTYYLSNIPYFKNYDDNSSDIPTSMVVASHAREYQKDALKAYISTKHRRSNLAACKDFIKIFVESNSKVESYLCYVVQNTLHKPDTIVLFYKERI